MQYQKVWKLFELCCIMLFFIYSFGVLFFWQLSVTQVSFLLTFGFLFAFMLVIALILFRKEAVESCQKIEHSLDEVLNGQQLTKMNMTEETMISRILLKIARSYEVNSKLRNDSLEKQKKMESLITDISHQAKTPITNLEMYTAFIQNSHVQEEENVRFFEIIQSQVKKLSYLIQNLVHISKMESGMIRMNMKNYRIYDTIANAIGGIRLKAQQKAIDIHLDCDDNVYVEHDSKWTSEVLLNLFDNAVKYTSSTGKIRVTVKRHEFYTQISVSDTGIGIERTEWNPIFERFYRSKDVSDKEGIGIGLYLAREIITLQKGYITVDSQKGAGSTFSVFLKNK